MQIYIVKFDLKNILCFRVQQLLIETLIFSVCFFSLRKILLFLMTCRKNTGSVDW